MQSVLAAQKKPSPKQLSRLFNFEAEYSKDFAERTVVPPAITENPAEITSQLTDDVWLIINGEKGSGKTSYLYYTRHELLSRLAGDLSDHSAEIPLYIAFDCDDIRSDISSSEEKTRFLVNYFYKPMLRELANYLNNFPQRPAGAEGIFSELIESLGLRTSEFLPLKQVKNQRKATGFSARFLRLFFGVSITDNAPSENGRLGAVGDDVNDEEQQTADLLPETGQLTDYPRFRDALIRLTHALQA
ncbi:MAG: hypothetical protein ACRDF4_04270, partial [Rhabdochlamydiaceae bacterium]